MIDLQTIQAGASAIRPYVYYTPLRPSYYFSEVSGFDVFMKPECWQPTGSFKIRGALNCINSMSPRERLQGIVAWSAGNHGLGVAYASRIFDVPATIFVPRNTPQSKLRKFKYYSVDLKMADTYDDCEREGRLFGEKEGALIVHPYDDWRTVAGQGTVGLEVCESMPELDAIVVPVGGGGLVSGIAIAAKSMDPEIKIIAVQSAASPSLKKSLDDDHCYEQFPVEHMIAEGIEGGIGQIVFDLAPKLIDEIIHIEQEVMLETVGNLLKHEQIIAETSAVVSLAALEHIECVPRGSRVACVLTGGNLDLRFLANILR